MFFILHYLAAWNIDCSKFWGRIKEKYFICRSVINNPLHNLHSGDTFLGPKGVPWTEVPLYSVVPSWEQYSGYKVVTQVCMVKEIQDLY